MPQIDLQDLYKISFNIGGIKNLSLTFEDNLNADLSFIDEGRVYGIKFRKRSAELEENTVDSPAGDYYAQKINFFIPRIRVEAFYVLTKLKNNRCVVIAEDGNALTHVLRGMRLAYKMVTGKRKSSSNGYNVTFTGKTLRKEYENSLIQGSVIGDPGTGSPGSGGGGETTAECCIIINPTQLGYIPLVSGNTSNLKELVTASDGSIWYIDKDGRGLKLKEARHFYEFLDFTGDTLAVPAGVIPAADRNEKVFVFRNEVRIYEGAADPPPFNGYFVNPSGTLKVWAAQNDNFRIHVM